jgi:hypothetical protein
MARKVYRTSQGKSIDLGALQLQNETVRAVGNMGVNARGDVINPQNVSVDSRNQSVNRHYKKQIRTNVSDDVIHDSKKTAQLAPKQKPTTTTPVVETEVETTIEEPVVTVEEPQVQPSENKKTKTQPLSGLAGAIAKSKQVKQEPMKTPRQLAQEKSGVKKI